MNMVLKLNHLCL